MTPCSTSPWPRLCRTLLLACLLGLVAATVQARSTMETHIVDTLGGEALIPTLRPLLVEGGSIGHYQGRLVIRTTAENFTVLRQVIADIDQVPRPVRISLRREANQQRSRQDAEVRVHSERGGSRAEARIRQGQQISSRQDDYHITTLDGHEAFIDRGQLLQLAGYSPNDRTLLPLLQGMTVRPRLLPNGQVELSVNQRFDEVDSAGQARTQGADTVLRVEAGEWRPLGGLAHQGREEDSGLLSRGSSTDSSQIILQIRVEPGTH